MRRWLKGTCISRGGLSNFVLQRWFFPARKEMQIQYGTAA